MIKMANNCYEASGLFNRLLCSGAELRVYGSIRIFRQIISSFPHRVT